MVVVTGGAGFIGANIVKGLDDRGIGDILVVDNLEEGDKFRNLTDCEDAGLSRQARIHRPRRTRRFRPREVQGHFPRRRLLRRRGAQRRLHDAEQLRVLEDVAALLPGEKKFGYLYASSAATYGAGKIFKETREHEAPLNVYGYSKFLFDQYVRRILPKKTAPIAGFRYFNVYGPREQHKGRMASVAFTTSINSLRPARSNCSRAAMDMAR